MIMITTYRVTDIKDSEEFINNVVNGLKYYETRNVDFKFKITYTDDVIEIKTVKLGVHAN